MVQLRVEFRQMSAWHFSLGTFEVVEIDAALVVGHLVVLDARDMYGLVE